MNKPPDSLVLYGGYLCRTSLSSSIQHPSVRESRTGVERIVIAKHIEQPSHHERERSVPRRACERRAQSGRQRATSSVMERIAEE